MAHPEQRQFFEELRIKFPQFFNNVSVIDCGSLDVNGTLRDFFTNSEYIGVDIVGGYGVDIIKKVSELRFKEEFDTVISGEMLEHDEYWGESLKKMYDMCKKGGLIAISCAGRLRPEHGTIKTGNIWGTSDDYYRNIEPKDITSVLKAELFRESIAKESENGFDTYFWGVKL